MGRWYDDNGKLPANRDNLGVSYNVATIFSNSVPIQPSDDYFVGHLWLMFASGCYFGTVTNHIIIPAYDLAASVVINPNLRREANWNLIGQAGSLPTSVTYFRENGFTHATYYATGLTNAGVIQMANGFIFQLRTGASFVPGPVPEGSLIPAYGIRKHTEATVTEQA